MTVGCSLDAEEGNVVSMRKSACTHADRYRSPPRRGHVLRSVQRPVLVNRHFNFIGRELIEGGAIVSVSKSGKPTNVGRTVDGAETNGRSHGSQRFTAPAREVAREADERKEVAASVQRGKESSGACPYVVSSCRSRKASSVSNTLRAALQKEWRRK